MMECIHEVHCQGARVFTGLLSRICELGGRGETTGDESWSRTGSGL